MFCLWFPPAPVCPNEPSQVWNLRLQTLRVGQYKLWVVCYKKQCLTQLGLEIGVCQKLNGFLYPQKLLRCWFNIFIVLCRPQIVFCTFVIGQRNKQVPLLSVTICQGKALEGQSWLPRRIPSTGKAVEAMETSRWPASIFLCISSPSHGKNMLRA